MKVLVTDGSYKHTLGIVRALGRKGIWVGVLAKNKHAIKWWSVYLTILKYLKTRNPWFASVRKIGEWWGRKNG